MEALPPEIVLQIATSSPPSWYSLVRVCRFLALFSRYEEKFRERLRSGFLETIRTSSYLLSYLPNGDLSGECEGPLLFYEAPWSSFPLPPTCRLRCTFSDNVLEGNFTILDVFGTRTLARGSYFAGRLHGPLSVYGTEGKLLLRTRFACGRQMGRSYSRDRHTSRERKTDYWLDLRWGREDRYLDGRLEAVINYCRGEVRGETLFFDREGLLRRRTVTEADGSISEKIFLPAGNERRSLWTRPGRIWIVTETYDGTFLSASFRDEKRQVEVLPRCLFLFGSPRSPETFPVLSLSPLSPSGLLLVRTREGLVILGPETCLLPRRRRSLCLLS